jgi:hypothetical protein
MTHQKNEIGILKTTMIPGLMQGEERPKQSAQRRKVVFS